MSKDIEIIKGKDVVETQYNEVLQAISKLRQSIPEPLDDLAEVSNLGHIKIYGQVVSTAKAYELRNWLINLLGDGTHD